MIGRLEKSGIESTSIKNAYETIIANMKLRSKGEKSLKALMITSCNPEEGKTTIAKGLAYYCAQNGIKTILVDCDLRKKKNLEEIIKKTPGLVECLEGETTLEKVIVQAEENLSFLQRGRETDQQIKLLMSKGFDELVKNLESEYDLVLLDGPSMQEGSDSFVVSVKTDGVILVVAKGVTTFKQLDDAEIQLEASGAKIWGVVLNETGKKGLTKRVKKKRKP